MRGKNTKISAKKKAKGEVEGGSGAGMRGAVRFVAGGALRDVTLELVV